ncbi:MAG: RdgB/HAM1 family non-canonical purine pyrophosphatase [Bacteroidota bacterium]
MECLETIVQLKCLKMQTLIFATQNPNKAKEVASMLDGKMDVKCLKDLNIDIEIPEPHDSLEKNASEKSKTIHQLTGNACFGEDTGLEVDALSGAPGVKTARFAGEKATAAENMELLLTKMATENNRKARFRTVISLMLENGDEYLFEGICEGNIALRQSGQAGFGYDPVFIPEGSEIPFAEMSLEEKNIFSHRKKAMAKLLAFIQSQYGEN